MVKVWMRLYCGMTQAAPTDGLLVDLEPSVKILMCSLYELLSISWKKLLAAESGKEVILKISFICGFSNSVEY